MKGKIEEKQLSTQPWSAIYSFWFGEPGTVDHGNVQEIWFGGGPELDDLIRTRFLADYEKAASGDHDGWMLDPQGWASLIVTLDQFPRNMFRGDPRSFATDVKALEIAKKLIDSDCHDRLITVEKMFAYLPLEHSENKSDQARCVDLFRNIDDHDNKSEWIDYAFEHKVIIDQFGRFPHRNEILGRNSTKDESDWLKSSDQRFGTSAEDQPSK